MDQGGVQGAMDKATTNLIGTGGLQPLPSSGMYDMPGKTDLNKELKGGR
jgi:hypothetical protein